MAAALTLLIDKFDCGLIVDNSKTTKNCQTNVQHFDPNVRLEGDEIIIEASENHDLIPLTTWR